MPIPIAAPDQVFAYYFQHMILVRKEAKEADFQVFLDCYQYEPVNPVLMKENIIWMDTEDLRRIFAPCLKIERKENSISLAYAAPGKKEKVFSPEESQLWTRGENLYLDLRACMYNMGKSWEEEGTCIRCGIDAPEDADIAGNSSKQKPLLMDVSSKPIRGEQFFTVWDEEADRLIPYRMYVPSSYESEKPMKTIVCFHGGNANADYVFDLTDNEICRYAEEKGYILLALTSYRKFTFFGASRFPTGTDIFDAEKENPLGLTAEQWEHSTLAERSVMMQIEDAAVRYTLDRSHLYAMGNSGGSLGIIHQVQYIGKPYFRAVCCAGGILSPSVIDYESMKRSGTEFLILYGSEDCFDKKKIITENMPQLWKNGLNARLHIVEGGDHLTAWTQALDIIFGFFDQHE